MSKLFELICQQFNESDFISRTYPALTEWGVKDEDVILHSLGCSVWNTLGHELGLMAVVEAPAPVGAGNDIRSDSVWFDRQSRQPEVLVEFERYDGTVRDKQKIEHKLSNLMEAYHRWECKPTVLILSIWSQGVVSAPDITGLYQRFSRGTTNSKGMFIPGIADAELMVNRFFFNRMPDGNLRLQSLSFSGER
ncbi:hypothetical protein [Photobacterium sp. OFAV2-7]|uniref:hypothetical protein n=1 Tax=Photobacterium sp. OFAV2-7 TaxID=2917748 RepID=UPI001EF6E1CC|nr:hypothetical protein [Photobacterium sp. OFAV2-7]MCG7584802.1 hypothetical protein [Photobacterium sp. OFAV2-7]